MDICSDRIVNVNYIAYKFISRFINIKNKKFNKRCSNQVTILSFCLFFLSIFPVNELSLKLFYKSLIMTVCQFLS